MTDRAAAVAAAVALLVALGSVPALPAGAAATSVGDASVSPTAVTTGEATTLSVRLDVAGVDTGDGTTGASVTVGAPDAVDLAGATATATAPATNVTNVSAAVDAEAGTVTLSWDDAGGTVETLPVAVDVAGATVTRTGSVDLTADVDTDASGGAELTATVGTVAASAATSDRSVTSTPATLYVGETDVDVTGLDGAAPAGESQRFYGTSGDAEGSVATASETLAVDVTAANGFETGGYAFSSGADAAAVSVVEPRVTDLTLSPGDAVTDVDVSNESVPRGTSNLTVGVEYNFDAAENVTVTVEDGAGVDVTPALGDDHTVTTSGGSVTLDASVLDAGTYTVTAEGADDLDAATRGVSVRVRDEEKVVSLSRTRVTRGDSTIASVAGAPGAVRYLRVDVAALRPGVAVNAPTARAVFDDTESVRSIRADGDLGVVYALVSLDDDGFADVRLRTDLFETGTADVELAGSLTGAAEDEATVEVTERRLSVDAVSPTVVGESVTVSGTAPESDRVKLYAEVGGRYVPLYEDGGDGTALAEPEVESGGAWSVAVDTSRVVDIPGTYRVVAVADPGEGRLGSTDAVDGETIRAVDVRDATALRTVEGRLTLSASRARIAATGDDEFTLAGAAVGQGDSVRLYHVGPRGDADVTVVDERDGTFAETVDGVDRRGTHTYLAVGPGRDGTYAHAPDGPAPDDLLSGTETPAAAVAEIRDAYDGAGADDPLVAATVRAVDESVAVDRPTADRVAASAADLAVAGRTTREDGATVFVELRGADGRAVRSATASVSNGTWNATLPLGTVPAGEYRLSVETGDATASRSLTVGEATTAAAGTGGGTASTSRPPETPNEAAGAGTDATERAATTDGPTATAARGTRTRLPGFGAATAAVALALALAFGAVRRARRGSGGR